MEPKQQALRIPMVAALEEEDEATVTTTTSRVRATTRRKHTKLANMASYIIITTIVISTTTLVSQSSQSQAISPQLNHNYRKLDISNSPVREQVQFESSPVARLPYYQHQHQQHQHQQQQQQHQHQQPYHHHHALIAATSSNRHLQNTYTDAAYRLLLDLRQQMLNRSIKFDENFRSLLSDSKRGLHNMFVKTYGLYYELNTDIFTNMFDDLEQYYAKGQIKIADSMKNFFDRLYQKVFQAFNVGKQFSPDYLHCVRAQVASLRPFKDVPDKIIDGIRHGFVAARSFRLALDKGVEVIKAIMSLEHTNQCVTLINEKLIRPPSVVAQRPSEGPASSRPCLSFCEQVLTRCFARDSLERLDESWKSYAFSLNKLAQKLSTSYNIETIVAPMDVQISEAIMNFQENGQNITDHVFAMCGAPRPLTSMMGGGGVQMAASIVGPIDSGKMKDSADSYGEQVLPVRSPTNRLKRRAAVRARQSNANRNEQQQQQQPQTGYNSAFGALMLDSSDRTPPVRANAGGLKPNQLVSQQTGAFIQHAPKESQITRSPEIIDEIKRYIQSTRNFWSALPSSVCIASNQTFNDRQLRPAAEGHATGKTTSPPPSQIGQSTCYVAQLGSHDINFDISYRREIQHWTGQLDRIRDKLEQAYLGIEVEWDSFAVVVPQNGGPWPPAGLPSNLRPTMIPASSISSVGFSFGSSSTTTLAPEDEEEEPTEDEMDSGEDGSEQSEDGSGGELDDSSVAESDTMDEPTEDYESESETSLDAETTQSSTLVPLTEPADNTLNDSNEPAGIPGELVTAPKRSSAHSSSKLVIQSCRLGLSVELQFVATLIMFVVMLNDHHYRNQQH